MVPPGLPDMVYFLLFLVGAETPPNLFAFICAEIRRNSFGFACRIFEVPDSFLALLAVIFDGAGDSFLRLGFACRDLFLKCRNFVPPALLAGTHF